MINFIIGSLCCIVGFGLGVLIMALGQYEWNKHDHDQSWPPRKEK